MGVQPPRPPVKPKPPVAEPSGPPPPPDRYRLRSDVKSHFRDKKGDLIIYGLKGEEVTMIRLNPDISAVNGVRGAFSVRTSEVDKI